MHCKVPVLNSIFVIQSKETKTRKGIINKNLKHQKSQMTTKLTVTTGTNGTLKQTKNFSRRLRQFAASLTFMAIAFAAMSFTQDDTTKKAEEKTNTSITTSVADSCCTVTFVNGIQHIVITNKNAFSADVRINNMDINTWVNSMMAYSYKKINVSSIGSADNTMDANFSTAELLNRKMAVAFGKNLKNETVDADVELEEVFNQTVAAPLYSRMLGTEGTEADVLMDKIMNDDADTRAKSARFSQAIETKNADAEMDFMINAAGLRNVSPATCADADRRMDDLLTRSVFKSISAAEVTEADKSIDELANNK